MDTTSVPNTSTSTLLLQSLAQRRQYFRSVEILRWVKHRFQPTLRGDLSTASLNVAATVPGFNLPALNESKQAQVEPPVERAFPIICKPFFLVLPLMPPLPASHKTHFWPRIATTRLAREVIPITNRVLPKMASSQSRRTYPAIPRGVRS